MDGEVYDEVDSSAGSRSFHIYNDLILPVRILAYNYGVYVIAAIFIIYQIVTRLIWPRVQQRVEHAATGAAKKSDAINDRHAEARRAARERQQAHHDKVAAEAEVERLRKEEEKRAEKLKKLQEEMNSRSVVENALVATREREKKEQMAKGDTEESPADFLLRMISSAPIVIVSKSFCPYSRKAKAAFATYRLPRDEVVYLELDELGEKREKAVQAELARLYERERVPAVFVAGDFIGDADTIVAHQRDGILDVLVRDATESWRKRKE